jgi:hypothetical protein
LTCFILVSLQQSKESVLLLCPCINICINTIYIELYLYFQVNIIFHKINIKNTTYI